MASVDPASLGGRLLAERAGELLRARDMVESLLAGTVAEARGRGLTGSTGCLGGWLPEVSRVRHGRAAYSRVGARARAVAGLPLVAGLHAGGEVSTAFLDAAGVGLDRLPEEAVATWDAMLAGEARDLDPADIPKLLAQFRAMISPEQVAEEADDAARRSSLHVSPYGSQGCWALNGTLHGLEGELVAKMLEHYARPRDAGDRRSRGERQAAALVQIFRIAQRARTDAEFVPAPRGAAGHVVVFARRETWHGEPGAPAATTAVGTVVDPGQFETVRCTTQPEVMLYDTPEADPTGEAGPTGETESEAERDARLVRGVLAGLLPPGVGIRVEPVAYAREARTASLGQWHMLIARDRHCVVERCTRGPGWSEAHHLREWHADQGPTDLLNMALVCWEHHTWLHRRGLHLHPPWCHCTYCEHMRATGLTDPGEWSVHPDVPVITMA